MKDIRWPVGQVVEILHERDLRAVRQEIPLPELQHDSHQHEGDDLLL